jgi:hypothetical protein
MSLLDLLGFGRRATPAATLGVCTCCARLDDDQTEKPVAYCSLCDAWLCDRCRGDYWRRARAALEV